jgi:hypothetical protein
MQELATGQAVHFASVAIAVGNWEWRILVVEGGAPANLGRRVEYEYRPLGSAEAWRGQAWWPAGEIPSEARALYAENQLAVRQELFPAGFPRLPGFDLFP